MLNIKQFRESIIHPALTNLLLYSKEAEELLVFTCANESNGGEYLYQLNGQALGIYQMEPRTYNDIWQNYLRNHPSLTMRLLSNFNAGYMPEEDRLIYDLRFATAMARIFYARIPEPLPSANDIDAIWNYYKRYYNTYDGAAEKDQAIDKYKKFIR